MALSSSLSWLPLSLVGSNSNLEVLRLEGIEYRALAFAQGESYKGGWRDGQPEGEGRYVWQDGAVYEGSWLKGTKHGWGQYVWPGGAVYLGEWRQGQFQGYGSFESPDGSRYQGGWANSLKEGIGTKWYANGDRYEGLWRGGVAEGPGRYVWAAGMEYDGEWLAGKMHGQGTLKWSQGQRYDGEWKEGVEEGIGVFSWQDGSTYEGFWIGGKKHGVGVFRSPAGRPGQRQSLEGPLEQRLSQRSSLQETRYSGEIEPGFAGDEPLGSPSFAGRGPRPADAALAELRGAAEAIYVCEYEQGRLVQEEAFSQGDLDLVLGPAATQAERAARRIGPRRRRRREDRMGETIFKGHRSFDLMLNLQLGIRYTLAALSKLPPPLHLQPEHYHEKVWLRFPRAGSEVTPPHPSTDFKWKDYCPTAFRSLREIFGITNSQYILSTCGDQALRELPSPGKSGSVFFVSHDDRFIIKTMRKEEVKLLLAALPRYHAQVAAHPDTLLTRFYGVHRVKPSQGAKVRFVVMNNIFRSDIPMHRKYDLKGSTYKRTAGANPGSSAVRKDLDLDATFRLPAPTRDRLMRQMQSDAAFLESVGVMDYSLLLGVHCRAQAETSATPHNTDREDEDGRFTAAGGDGQDEGEVNPRSGVGPRISPFAGVAVDGDSGSELAPPSTLPSVDLDGELTQSMHTVSLKDVTITDAAPRGGFGFRSFMAWRREQQEKGRQLKEQRTQARVQHRLEGTTTAQTTTAGAGAAGATSGLSTRVAPTPSAPAPTANDADAGPGGASSGRLHQSDSCAARPSSAPLASQPVTQPVHAAQHLQNTPLVSPGPASLRLGTRPSHLGRLTYSQQLAHQHATLVNKLQTATPRATTPFSEGRPTQDEGALSTGISWRADAAEMPQASAYPPPVGAGESSSAPASAATTPTSAAAAQHARHARQYSLNLALATVHSTVSSSSSSEAASPVASPRAPAVSAAVGQPPHFPSLAGFSSPFGRSPGPAQSGVSLGRSDSLPATPFASRHSLDRSPSAPPLPSFGGLHMVSSMREVPSTVDLSSPDVAPVAARMRARLARPIGDRLLQDLLRLSRYKMLAPSAARESRVPSTVLVARHTRQGSSCQRASLDEDAAIAVAAAATGGSGRPMEVPTAPLGQSLAATALAAVPAAGEAEGEEVLLFLGLIDWLQPYNMRKKLEHGFKAVVQDARGISVIEPSAYARRFMAFMDKVFCS